MSKTPFKILKLKSGDDIVAHLIKNTKEFIRLERPMLLKVMHYVDNLSGNKRETVVLVDWLKATTSNHIDIPRDHILGIFDCDPDILQAYDFQKRLDDNPQLGFKMDDPRQMKLPFGKKPQIPPPNIDNILKIVAAKIEDMKSQIDKEMDDRDIEEALEAMGMDPESIKEIIDDDDVDVDVEMIDNKNRKDYGESFMDWSPKLDDYLT